MYFQLWIIFRDFGWFKSLGSVRSSHFFGNWRAKQLPINITKHVVLSKHHVLNKTMRVYRTHINDIHVITIDLIRAKIASKHRNGAGLATGIQGIYNWNSIFVVNLFSESHRETDVCVMSIIFQWKPGRFNGRFTTSWIFQKHHHPTDINWYILYIVYTHIMSALGPIV